MFFTCRRSADVVMAEDLEMGGPRPSRRWRAEGHCREVTVSKGVPLCSQQGSCVLGFHMGLQCSLFWPQPLGHRQPLQ